MSAITCRDIVVQRYFLSGYTPTDVWLFCMHMWYFRSSRSYHLIEGARCEYSTYVSTPLFHCLQHSGHAQPRLAIVTRMYPYCHRCYTDQRMLSTLCSRFLHITAAIAQVSICCIILHYDFLSIRFVHLKRTLLTDITGACQRIDVEIHIYVDMQSLHTSLLSILW